MIQPVEGLERLSTFNLQVERQSWLKCLFYSLTYHMVVESKVTRSGQG